MIMPYAMCLRVGKIIVAFSASFHANYLMEASQLEEVVIYACRIMPH